MILKRVTKRWFFNCAIVEHCESFYAPGWFVCLTFAHVQKESFVNPFCHGVHLYKALFCKPLLAPFCPYKSSRAVPQRGKKGQKVTASKEASIC